MKRMIIIALAGALLVCFASCKKVTEPTTTAPTETTTQATTAETTAAPTTESTTAAKADISFIYSGYWYKNEGSKVLALRFESDGSLIVNTFRRKNITSANNAPDSILYGSFKDNGDGTLYVYPDNEAPDEYYIYVANSDGKTLTCENDDPQLSAVKRIELVNFDSLSKENAAKVLAANN